MGMPRIGDAAPNFTAITTHGELDFHTWKGSSWCLLFSHPADFTPVCTTELTGLAQRNDELSRRGVKLLGLSIDSVHAHLAWRENIKEKLGVGLPFPLIADLDAKVAEVAAADFDHDEAPRVEDEWEGSRGGRSSR